ncbi:Uncharacterised protein [Vibrio cholerae]|nr:Uncharacterised protein [Vibrio cholerae]
MIIIELDSTRGLKFMALSLITVPVAISTFNRGKV